MAKDPAFLFYPNDFSSGTQFFTDEQVGKYMRLLMAQHQHGHLQENHVLQICKSYDKDVMSKFKKDEQGLWYNERLEIEVEKRKNYSKSRSENRSKSTKENNISVTYDNHMENRNGINNNIKEQDFFESNAQAYMLMSGNYHDMDGAKTVISNIGWPGVQDQDVKAILHHFLETQAEIPTSSKSVRSHFRRWLNKQDSNKLRSLSKTIIENHARRVQGQATEVRGNAGNVPAPGG